MITEIIKNLDLSKCYLNFGVYVNGEIQFSIIDEKNILIVNATIKCHWIRLKSKQVIIKSYQENEGLYEILYKSGVIGKVKKKIPIGYYHAFLCDLLIEPKNN